jgi:hypothetical protein
MTLAVICIAIAWRVQALNEPKVTPAIAAVLCFLAMVGAVSLMSWIDFGSSYPRNMVAELGNGE